MTANICILLLNSVCFISFHHSEGVWDTEVGLHVRMVPLVVSEMGNVDPVALVELWLEETVGALMCSYRGQK